MYLTVNDGTVHDADQQERINSKSSSGRRSQVVAKATWNRNDGSLAENNMTRLNSQTFDKEHEAQDRNRSPDDAGHAHGI
jgi:hypothetical protein